MTTWRQRSGLRFGRLKTNIETICATNGVNDQSLTSKLHEFIDLTLKRASIELENHSSLVRAQQLEIRLRDEWTLGVKTLLHRDSALTLRIGIRCRTMHLR